MEIRTLESNFLIDKKGKLIMSKWSIKWKTTLNVVGICEKHYEGLKTILPLVKEIK